MKRSTRWMIFTPFWFLVFILLLCTLVLTLSPWAARHFGDSYLQAFGVRTSADTLIRLNPFDSTITVRDLKLQQGENTTLHIDALDIEYALWPLLNKHIVIEKLQLGDAGVDLQLDPEQLRIAGIDPTQSTETNQETTNNKNQSDSGSPLSVSIQNLTLKNLVLNVTRGEASREIAITRFALPTLEFEAQQLQGNFEFLGKLAGGELELHADFDSDNAQHRIALDFRAQHIQIAQFSDWTEIDPTLREKTLDLKFSLDAQDLPEQ